MKRLAMKPIPSALLFLWAASSLVAWAAPDGSAESEAAAEVQSASQREAFAGRRLSAAELAQLREQVRAQWSARSEAVVSSSESPRAEQTMLPMQNRGSGPGWHPTRP